MIQAISPSEVITRKAEDIPEVVIDSFNHLIAKNWDGSRSKILQEDVVSEIMNRDPLITSRKIFSDKMLNVEEIYRERGWKVTYDKPAYNETYKSSFTFTNG